VTDIGEHKLITIRQKLLR